MLQQGRIVLLFDGFDELVTRLTYDRAADHLQTCSTPPRTRPRSSSPAAPSTSSPTAQVLTALGERVGLLPQRRVLAVQDFTPARSAPTWSTATAATAGRRPPAAAARRHPRPARAVPATRGCSASSPIWTTTGCAPSPAPARALSAAGLYQEMLTSWLQYEEQRGQGGAGAAPGLEPGPACGTRSPRSRCGCGTAARAPCASTNSPRSPSTLTGPGGHQALARQTAHAIGSGSLLVRTDEGLFRFIHAPSWSGWWPARQRPGSPAASTSCWHAARSAS